MQVSTQNPTADEQSEGRVSRERDWYLSLRRRYQPIKIRLILVAESPPASGRYFYDPTGSVSEPLFKAFMQCLKIEPSTKEEGLRRFQSAGWILVDATYEAVNALDNSGRNTILLRDYPLLRDDLLALTPNRIAPLILIKANVCRLLEPRLTAEGFSVLNRGSAVYFPSHGRQNDFQKQFAGLTKNSEFQLAVTSER